MVRTVKRVRYFTEHRMVGLLVPDELLFYK